VKAKSQSCLERNAGLPTQRLDEGGSKNKGEHQRRSTRSRKYKAPFGPNQISQTSASCSGAVHRDVCRRRQLQGCHLDENKTPHPGEKIRQGQLSTQDGYDLGAQATVDDIKEHSNQGSLLERKKKRCGQGKRKETKDRGSGTGLGEKKWKERAEPKQLLWLKGLEQPNGRWTFKAQKTLQKKPGEKFKNKACI